MIEGENAAAVAAMMAITSVPKRPTIRERRADCLVYEKARSRVKATAPALMTESWLDITTEMRAARIKPKPPAGSNTRARTRNASSGCVDGEMKGRAYTPKAETAASHG